MAIRAGDVVPHVSHYIVLQVADSLLVHIAEPELRIGIALLGGLATPADGFLVVSGNAVALGVHNAEPELRLGMALLCEWLQVLQRRCVVFPVICGIANLVVRLKALRCDGLRQRYRKDQQGYDG